MAEENEFSRGTGERAEDDIKARIEAMVQTAVDEANMRFDEERPEIAEPENWWNLYAYGPIQPWWMPHLPPSKIIRVGEAFYMATIVWLNPRVPRPVSACELLTNMCGKLQIRYCTGEVCEWRKGPDPLNVTHVRDFIPNRCWYVDYLYVGQVPPGWEGCYEMTICARVIGCEDKPGAKLPFAGYATQIYDVDWDTFYPSVAPPGYPPPPPGVGPHWRIDIPIKFMIYS